MKIYKVTTEKLKELKTWAQVKSPKTFQPALSYALDWLAPELLGTGLRLFEVGEHEIKAVVPANSSNLDFQKEIHQGLITNASLELARVFLQRQMPESFFQIVSTELQIFKKQKWTDDIKLILKSSQSEIDDFFIDVQKGKTANIHFTINIESEKFKKKDSVILKLVIEATPLLA